MKLTFGFGKGTQEVDVSKRLLLGELHANPVTVELTEEEELRRALASPIGAPPLSELVHPGEKIVLVTSDITRPMPTWKVMPALLDLLYGAGCAPSDITLVFALGSHRHQTDEEKRHLAGERAWSEIRCIDSDPEDCVLLGTTSAGTPVAVTRTVAEADRVICLGNIEYHYFAGYSGGAKAIMPGCSTPEAIQANHSMMVRPECCAGSLEGNPLRADIEEAGRILGIDYIVNVVLSEHKEILRAVAGDPVLAHREGCRFLDSLYLKELPAPADIVIVSQGGAPKDLNLYQTQKALDNAAHAVRDGGAIILIGSCAEGLGSAVFEEWMNDAKRPEDLIERVRTNFRLGGHKAAAIAMVLRRAAVFLVSDLPDETVRNCFLTPAKSARAALREARKLVGADAKILAMPYGGSTLPKVREAEQRR